MPFKYTYTNTDKIVFTRLGAGCGRALFIFAGALFTIIGFCLLYFSKSTEMPILVFRYFTPAFGLLAIYVGIMLPKFQSISTPDEIVFDNLNGRVEVNQKNSEINTAYIYYDEIADFIVKAKKTDSSSSNSGRSYYSHHVYLLKKDGGEWELLKLNNEADAIAEIVKLKLIIKLSVEPKRVQSGLKFSSKYTVKKSYQKMELSWRNKAGYGFLILGVFAAVFITFAYAIFSSASMKGLDLPIFAYFVGGFIGIVFVIVIGGNTMKMIKNMKTVYAVVISNSVFEYIEKDEGDRVKKDVRIPLHDLHAISFSFDTDNSYRKIYVYTHEQHSHKRALKPAFSVAYFKKLYDFYQSIISLEIQGLTAVEALYIESFLQEQIKDLGNADVA